MVVDARRERLAAIGSGLRRGAFVVTVFSLAVNLLVLAAPLYMLQVFDRVLTSRSTDTLVLITVICASALVIMALVDIARARVSSLISSWLDRAMGPQLFEGAVLQARDKRSAPSTQVLRDLRTTRSFVSSPQLFAFFDAPWAPIFLVVMFALHPLLGLVALVGAVLLFILAILNEWLTRRPAREDGGASAKAIRIADSSTRNADSVAAMGMLPALRSRWAESAMFARVNQGVVDRRTALIVSTSKSLRMVLQMAILGTGAWLAVAGEVTPGVMIAGSILMGRALAPVEQAIGAWRTMLGARSAWQRVKQGLLTAPVEPDSMELPAPAGAVTVSGASVMVEGAREPVLRNVSFKLEPGESLAVIGPSGSGKSTLARLLMGNVVPRTGHVRLDGMDVSAWSSDQLGPHCGYLPQDIELFDGTVRDNIARMAEPEPERIVTAAQQAGCHQLILSLPEGYDTEVGDAGRVLSGGTRQRVALARALYGTPAFVVLDEPNSNLDRVGEASLQAALNALSAAGTTVVLIGHRESTLEQIDKVLVLVAGAVEFFGTREEFYQSRAKPAPGAVAAPKEPAAAPSAPAASPARRPAVAEPSAQSAAASPAAPAAKARKAPAAPATKAPAKKRALRLDLDLDLGDEASQAKRSPQKPPAPLPKRTEAPRTAKQAQPRRAAAPDAGPRAATGAASEPATSQRQPGPQSKQQPKLRLANKPPKGKAS